MSEKWIENSKGNWVWVGSDRVCATVYGTHDGMWGAIWNGAADGRPRRLKGKFDYAEDAREAVQIADLEGEASSKWYPPDDEWLKSKKGGYYRKVNGAIVSVKQAKSKSWYAVSMEGALLGLNNRAAWFPTAEEACKSVDEFAADIGAWHWITRH